MTILPFVVAGLTTGSLYSIAAMGLVLTYKTSGIFNFAHGATAAASAYVFFELRERMGVPWPMAAAFCVLVLAPVVGVVMERIASSATRAPVSARIVATVGLLVAVQATLTAVFGAQAIDFPPVLPTHTFALLGVNVGVDQAIAFVLAATAAAGLYAFFRLSTLGIAMRGVVDDSDLLDLTGVSPTRVRVQAWIIGSSFTALSGILLAPKLGLDATLLTLLVVQAFGAAAIGRFASLPMTYVGGLVVGVGSAVATKFVPSVPSLAGFPPSFPFIVLFVVLLATPRGRLAEVATRRRLGPATTAALAPAWTWAGRAATLVALALLPALVGTRLSVYTNGLVFVLVFLSLNLLVRTSGQVSLCHAAFAAIGAATFSNLAHGAGVPWGVAVVGAGLAAVPIGAVIAVPAIRLSGLYLALATFGFGLLIERMAFPTALMFGKAGNRPAPRPGVLHLGTDTGFYFVCLVFVVLAYTTVVVLNRSRLGLLLRAMAESPVALVTHGLSVNVTKVLVLCLSAFLAGVAGALFAALGGTISGTGFGAFASLTWLTVLVVAGVGELSAAFVAAFLLAVVPSYFTGAAYTRWQPVVFGVLAIVAALNEGSLDLGERFRSAARRSEHRRRHSPVTARQQRLRLAPAGHRGAT